MYRRSSARSRSYSPPQQRSSRPRSRPRSKYASDSRSPSPSSQSPPPSRRAPGPKYYPPQTTTYNNNNGNTPTRRSGGTRRSRYPPDPSIPPTPNNNNNHFRSSSRKKEVTLLLCVFSSTSHTWKTHPFTFTPSRTNDRTLWSSINHTYNHDLKKPYQRILGFTRVKSIVPIAFSPNMCPLRTSPENFPEAHQLVHAYHHPDELRTTHEWVDYLTAFDAGDTRTNGLEFMEGIYAEKLMVLGVLCTVAIIVVCIVWCVLGGDLQTVFTVMGFVLTLIAAQIALIALYYQIVGNDSPSAGGGGGGGASASGGSDLGK